MTDKELAETIEKADELTTLKMLTTAIVILAQNSSYMLIILGIIMCCQITQCK
jgi:hypothetical protein